MELILASGSPRRRELLALTGLKFTVMPSAADETLPRGMEPRQAVEYLSRKKAEACPAEEALVLGADTVVALDSSILGKPADPAQAQAMLSALSGRSHRVFTGVTLRLGGRMETFSQETQVYFYPLTAEEIGDYVETGEPMDKAGAYGIQGRGGLLVEKIQGDYFNVVGLPVALLVRRMQAFLQAEGRSFNELPKN